MLDLRSDSRRPPVALDGAASFDDESRCAAIAEWTERMVDEHASSRLFAGLVPQMMRAGVDADFQVAAAQAVVDELRHARLCAAVVEALGGEACAPMPAFDDLPRHTDVGALEALLRNVITICCLEQTVSVGLLENKHRSARESTLRRVIAEILDDEIVHSRLGWSLLKNLAPRIDSRMRERLGAYLVPAIARLFEKHLASRGAPRIRAVDEKVLFIEVMNEVVVPRLEAFDLPARAAVDAALAAPEPADEVVLWAATD